MQCQIKTNAHHSFPETNSHFEFFCFMWRDIEKQQILMFVKPENEK